jgi:hypothetical protein
MASIMAPWRWVSQTDGGASRAGRRAAGGASDTTPCMTCRLRGISGSLQSSGDSDAQGPSDNPEAGSRPPRHQSGQLGRRKRSCFLRRVGKPAVTPSRFERMRGAAPGSLSYPARRFSVIGRKAARARPCCPTSLGTGRSLGQLKRDPPAPRKSRSSAAADCPFRNGHSLYP